MTNQPSDLGYETKQKLISFRQEGSIKIPKFVREEAFSMEVSVEIQSTAGGEYLNTKVLPDEYFFGYATLVFYDYVTKIIPIKFGRNTLYYERNDTAYTDWEMYKFYAYTKYDFYRLTNVVGQLASQFGFTVTPNPYPMPDWKGFVELPLREVYIKCPYGTRFQIEVNWETARAFYSMDETDPNGKKPKSRREDDPKKDAGLPAAGIAPSNNGSRINANGQRVDANGNPTTPYAGYPEPSSFTDRGLFDNPKGSLPANSINGVNPVNNPTLPSNGGGGNGTPQAGTYNWYLEYRTQLSPTTQELFVTTATDTYFAAIALNGNTYTLETREPYTAPPRFSEVGIDGSFIYYVRYFTR